MKRLVLLSMILALLAVTIQPVIAKPPKGLNATDLSMVDGDFTFQGSQQSSNP